MSKFMRNYTQDYVEGREEDYVDHVRVFVESEAIRPGSTKIREISIKPVTVHSFMLNY